MSEGDRPGDTSEPSEQLRQRNRFIAVGLLAAVGFCIASVADFLLGAQPTGLATTVDILQGLVTIAGILIAGAWGLYVFVLGRSYTANVQIQFDLKQVVELTNSKAAVVSIKVRNAGRTRVKKSLVQLRVQPITDEELDRPGLMLVPTSVDLLKAKGYPIFRELAALEPDEEVAEDVILAMAHYSRAKVEVHFVGRVFRVIFGRGDEVAWVARGMLDTQMVEEGERGAS